MPEATGEKLIISCREATFLISKKCEHPIGMRNGLRLLIHLIICEFCRRFSKQTRMIEEEARRLLPREHLTAEEKSELQRKVEAWGRKS